MLLLLVLPLACVLWQWHVLNRRTEWPCIAEVLLGADLQPAGADPFSQVSSPDTGA